MRIRKMTRNAKLTVSALVAFVVIVVGGGAAFGANQLSLIDLTPVPPAPAASSDIQESFSVLRADARVSSASAEFKKSLAEEPLLRSKGGNPERAVAISTGSGDAWIVPGKDHVCVYLASPPGEFGFGGTCGSTAEARSGKLATWSMDEHGEKIRGVALVPDGTATVTAVDASGNVESLAVKNNVVSFGGPNLKSLSIGRSKHEF